MKLSLRAFKKYDNHEDLHKHCNAALISMNLIWFIPCLVCAKL